MSHFAELDENNVVIRVLVGDNNLPNEGYDWFVQTFGGRWVQSSYNKKFRKNHASVGFVYDEQRDAFIPPKPFDSWVLDEESCTWKAPVPISDFESSYEWDEENKAWVNRV